MSWSQIKARVQSLFFQLMVGVYGIRATMSNGVRLLTADGWLTPPGFSRVATNVTNATITPAAITGLSATLPAGAKVTGEMVLFCEEVTADDGLRIDFDGGTATMTTFLAQGHLGDDTSVRPLARTTALATDITDSSIAGSTLVVIKLAFTVNAAGTFIPRVAKEADAAAANLTVTAGSFMKLDIMS